MRKNVGKSKCIFPTGISYNEKTMGSSIEPWGTPRGTVAEEAPVSLALRPVVLAERALELLGVVAHAGSTRLTVATARARLRHAGAYALVGVQSRIRR